MGRSLTRLAVTLIGMTCLATTAYAQGPPAPDDVLVPPTRTHPPVAKSDQHRVVGKVVHIDQSGGRVKLATETEGVVDVPAPAATLRAIRVGETVSVPRASEGAPSASPR